MKKIVPVTVIVPTFNRKSLLDKALHSVMEQTVQPREVIVVDDGSSDGSGDMLQERYPRVTYLYQANQGVSKARNAGIAIASSPWIALLDSDDQWLPEKLQRQLDCLDLHPEYVVCHTEEIWIRHGKRVNPMNKHQKYGGDIYDKCLPLCAMSPSSTVIHRKVFDQVGGFDETLPACEDYDLWLRICARYPVLFIDTPLIVKYGGHQDQLSRRYWGMDRFRIQALVKQLKANNLSKANYQLTLAMLREKVAIYVQGAMKRGKHAEAGYYQNLLAGVTNEKVIPIHYGNTARP